MEDAVVMTLVKFIVTGIMVSAFSVGTACALKAIVCVSKAVGEEAGRREENDDK